MIDLTPASQLLSQLGVLKTPGYCSVSFYFPFQLKFPYCFWDLRISVSFFFFLFPSLPFFPSHPSLPLSLSLLFSFCELVLCIKQQFFKCILSKHLIHIYMRKGPFGITLSRQKSFSPFLRKQNSFHSAWCLAFGKKKNWKIRMVTCLWHLLSWNNEKGTRRKAWTAKAYSPQSFYHPASFVFSSLFSCFARF